MNYQDEIKIEYKKLVTRRHFFKDCGVGLGSLALASLLTDNLLAQGNPQSKNPLAPKPPHFKAQSQTRDLFVPGGRAVAA